MPSAASARRIGPAAAQLPPFGGLSGAARPLKMEVDPGVSGMKRATSHQPGSSLGSSPGSSPASCLGRTCLQWGRDGELASVDLELVLERLAQVEQDMAAERQRTLSPCPCPSIS